jgi:hypothetical protein
MKYQMVGLVRNEEKKIQCGVAFTAAKFSKISSWK